MTALFTGIGLLAAAPSVPPRRCADLAHSVPDPVHADSALCPEVLGREIVRRFARGDATELLLDRALVPNNAVPGMGHRDGGQNGHGGEDGG
jgi:hypothetical protein